MQQGKSIITEAQKYTVRKNLHYFISAHEEIMLMNNNPSSQELGKFYHIFQHCHSLMFF